MNRDGKLSDSNDPHDSNGSERVDLSDLGPFPDFLRRDVSPDRWPALGPLGDSLDDFQ
ncbi:MAG TPA: hypothetical protein VKD02_05565 [Methyloceanibacter sp.]|nr:hypothetical protein [Methyloceanibacter sp.]